LKEHPESRIDAEQIVAQQSFYSEDIVETKHADSSPKSGTGDCTVEDIAVDRLPLAEDTILSPVATR
jgi:hypothetical protein